MDFQPPDPSTAERFTPPDPSTAEKFVPPPPENAEPTLDSWGHVVRDNLNRFGQHALNYFGNGLTGIDQTLAARDRQKLAQDDEAMPVMDPVNWLASVSPDLFGKPGSKLKEWAQGIPTDPNRNNLTSTKVVDAVSNIGIGTANAVIDPPSALMMFSAGTGQELADQAKKAGKPQEVQDEARNFGNGIGFATAVAPVNRIHSLLEGVNVNPYVKQIAKGLVLEMDKPDRIKQLVNLGIEGAKSGALGAASGAAYRVGMNTGAQEFVDPNTPTMQGVAQDAATFGGAGLVMGPAFALMNRHTETIPVNAKRAGEPAPGEPLPSSEAPAAPQSAEQQFLARTEAQPTAPEPAPAGPVAVNPTAFVPPRPEDAEVPPGDETTVIGTKGTEIPARYIWLPDGQVQASHTGEMLAPNPAYPLTNTRDYSNPDEKDKALATRNDFDPRRHVTDSVDASVGPAVVAGVTDEDGNRQLVVLGGNNRQWATTNLSPEKRAELLDYSNKRADRFGLSSAPSPDAQIYRYVGDFDLRSPGTRDQLQGVVDALNPSPGMVQGAAKMAENDALAGNVTPEQLASVPMDADPKSAQEFVAGLIGNGTLDRNTRSQIVQSPAASQDYLQRLVVNAGFRVPQIAEARQDSRRVAVRGMIDAAAPVLVNLRAQGEHGIADAVSRAFTTTLDYMNRGHELPEALDTAARQSEMGPEHEVAQQVATAMRGTVEKDARGKIKNEETVANLRGLFADIGQAVQNFSPMVNLWGDKEWIGEAVKRGIELNARRRGIVPEGQTAEVSASPTVHLDMEPGGKFVPPDISTAEKFVPPDPSTAERFVPPRPEDAEVPPTISNELQIRNLTDVQKQAALEQMPPVSIDAGPLLGLKGSELRIAAKAEWQKLVNLPQPVLTLDGRPVQFTMSGFKEIRQHSADARVLLVTPGLPRILANAIPLWREPSTKIDKPNIRAFYNYAAKVTVGNEEFYLRMVVREDNDGHVYFDHDATSMEEMKPNGQPDRKPNAGEGQPASVNKLSEWWNSVKSESPYADGKGGSGMVRLDAKGNPYAVVEMRGLADVKAFQMPELVKLCKELAGAVPELKKLTGARGLFRPRGRGEIALDWRIFENPEAAAKTLAHEIGHLIDYLPDHTMARGNILGRLAVLQKFRAETLADHPTNFVQGLSQKTRAVLRQKAVAEVGPCPSASCPPATLQAWRDAVSLRYAKLITYQCQLDKLVTRDAVMEELIALSQWWKPYDPLVVPKSYRSYRESAPEVYADALSVLFNSSAHLQEMAPTFWKVFFNYLDRKPEVEKAFFEFQDWLQRPALERANLQARDIKAMFGKGEEIFLRKTKEKELRHQAFAGWFDRFKEQVYDRFDPIIRKQQALEKAGKYVAPSERMDWVFEEHVLAQNKAFRWLQRLHENVVAPAEKDGFTLEDVGELLFLHRIQNEDFEVTAKVAGRESVVSMGRSKLANPLGITPEVARRQLLRMRLNLGIRRMTLLENAVTRFHDMVFEAVTEAHDAQLLDDEKFEMLKANRANYAAFVPLDYVETYVPSSIAKQTGTFSEIANPFVSTVLKAVAMHRAAQVNRTKLASVRFLQQHFPAEIVPAQVYRDGSGMLHARPVKEEGRELLQLREGGKMAFYEVDDAIAGFFEELTPAHANAVIEVLGHTFNKIFYPIFIQYNPVFLLWNNPIRDFQKAWKSLNVAGPVSRLKLLKTYWDAYGTAAARVRGESNPILADMLENFAIGTPYDMAGVMGQERGDAFGAIMERFHLLPEAKKQGFIHDFLNKTGIIQLVQKMEMVGNALEVLPKIAAWRILTGAALGTVDEQKTKPKLGKIPALGAVPAPGTASEMGFMLRLLAARPTLGTTAAPFSRSDAAEFIRNYIGLPNVNRKGKVTLVMNKLIPFFNVWVQGFAADARMATRGFKGKGRARWWFTWASLCGVQAVIKALADLGVFGDSAKKLNGGISDYDKTNYMTCPIGSSPGGDFGSKTVFLRGPMDETDRLLAGILYKTLLTAGRMALKEPNSGWSSVFAFGAGQVPGIHPLFSMGNAWADYLAGQNPMDSFHNRPVLSNDQFLAGGWEGAKGMMGWTWQQSGLGNFVSYNPQADTTTEMAVSMTPILNKILKFSDYGYREQQRRDGMVEPTRMAEVHLAMPDNVKTLANEYNTLKAISLAQRTDTQQARYAVLASWKSKTYQPMEEAFIHAQDENMPTSQLLKDLSESSKGFER